MRHLAHEASANGSHTGYCIPRIFGWNRTLLHWSRSIKNNSQMRADTGTALVFAVNKRLFILARSVPLGRWKSAGHASVVTCRSGCFEPKPYLQPMHSMHAEQQ